MKLSDLIKHLEKLKEEHGDLPTHVQTLTHQWAPEPTAVKDGKGKYIYVLLNP